MSAETVELVGGPLDGRIACIAESVERLVFPTAPVRPFFIPCDPEAAPAIVMPRDVVYQRTRRTLGDRRVYEWRAG
jgi:hypothetical protein